MANQAQTGFLGTGFQVFSRLVPVTCFPALGTSFKFSHAWYQIHVFPRLASSSDVYQRLVINSYECLFQIQTDSLNHLRLLSADKMRLLLYCSSIYHTVTKMTTNTRNSANFSA